VTIVIFLQVMAFVLFVATMVGNYALKSSPVLYTAQVLWGVDLGSCIAILIGLLSGFYFFNVHIKNRAEEPGNEDDNLDGRKTVANRRLAPAVSVSLEDM